MLKSKHAILARYSSDLDGFFWFFADGGDRPRRDGNIEFGIVGGDISPIRLGSVSHQGVGRIHKIDQLLGAFYGVPILLNPSLRKSSGV
jgi:hypothetical protein